MPSTRLLASTLAACLLATPVFAQTPAMTTSSTSTTTTRQAGSGAQATISTTSSTTTATYRPITPSASANIIAELTSAGEFTILLKALTAANLSTLIASHPNLTLIAPTDAAFAALPASQVAMLMDPANAAQLQALLTYHLINAKVTAADVEHHAAGPVPTVANKPVTFDGSGPILKINDATVLQSGVPASNGTIYVVDKVLTPPA
jgi:uncharacterized surface protein with fasciclin (FAS1) repeats